ncbi:MAG: response regulator, partial [Leptospiraceae bacterium]|nr:response regulator [Leptospiraceae bacterium]
SKNLSLVQIKKEEDKVRGKILIADDSLTTRVQIKRILELEGFEVELAYDGQDAYEKLINNNFQCLISDIEMPRMDGIQLVKKIKDSKWKSLPVILLTSLSSPEHVKAGLDAGAETYLIKSKFNRNDLLQIVKRYI